MPSHTHAHPSRSQGKLGRALKPEEYDTRTKTKPFQKGAKKFTKSGTINRRDASTW